MAGLLDPPLTPQQRYRKSKGLLTDQFDRPTYYEQEPVERSELFPVGVYPGGQIGFAVPGVVYNGLSAPYRAATGELGNYEDNRDEFIKAGSDAAGFATAGGLLTPKPANAVGMFGGRLAKTADHTALAKAEKMASEGVPREQIWKDTGWFKGVDGKWRFEINDSKATWRYGDETPGPLTNKFSHKELTAAYPDLVDARLSRDGRGAGGAYIAPFASKPEIFAIGNVPDTRSTLLHELQHGVQAREGFSPGASIDFGHALVDVERAARDAYNANRKNLGKPPTPDDELLAKLGIKQPDVSKPWEDLTSRERLEWNDAGRGRLYWNNAGEAEARAVQKRRDMTQDQRRERPPWLDYDVPEDKQIVRYGEGLQQSFGGKLGTASHEAANALGERPHRTASMSDVREWAEANGATFRDDVARTGSHYAYVSKPGMGTIKVRWGDHPPVYNDVGDKNFLDLNYSGLDKNAVNDALDWRFTTRLTPENAALSKAETKSATQERRLSPYDITQQKLVSGLQRSEDLRKAVASVKGAVVPSYVQDIVRRQAGVKNVQAIDLYNAMKTWEENPQYALFSNGGRPAAGVGLTANALADRPPGIRAYHGSPHDFDRFDMSKIGTGEGAQAYGHGLYFAENEGVAKGYRDTLTQRQGITAPRSGKTPDETAALEYFNRYAKADDTLESFERKFKHDVGQELEPRTALDAWQAMVKDGRIKEANGRMYEVNIHAHPDDFLDWDKPLSQQSEKVRGALPPDLPPEWTGQQVLDEARSFLMQNQPRNFTDVPRGSFANFDNNRPEVGTQISSKLREQGIPGIKYLDQGSRVAGEGSRNYVVFDDKLISILRKYGLLGMLGGAAAGGMLDGEAQKPKVDWKRSMLPGDA